MFFGENPDGVAKPTQAGFGAGMIVNGILASGKFAQQMHPS